MKKENKVLVVEESAVVKEQKCEIPMLALSSGSENYVIYLLVKIIVYCCYFNYSFYSFGKYDKYHSFFLN